MSSNEFWNRIAQSYNDYVVSSTAPKDFLEYEKKEEEYIFKQISRTLKNNDKGIDIIEFGSGTGRLLLGILENLKKQIDKIFYLGIDFAENMKVVCTRRFEEYPEEAKQHFQFVNADFSKEDFIKNMLEFVHKDTPNVIMLMFGTFGNLSLVARKKTLENIKTLMDEKGECYLSVFNKEYLEKQGFKSYRKIKELLTINKLEELKYDPDKGEVATVSGFYTHWFSLAEIKELINESGLKVKDVYEPTQRGWVMRINK